MEPFVSPWTFYFIHLFNTLHILSIVVAVIGLLVGLVVYFSAVVEGDKEVEKLGKYSLIAALVFAILAIILPDENTMYKMIAVSYATPDNLSAFENETIDFIEKLAEAISRHIK